MRLIYLTQIKYHQKFFDIFIDPETKKKIIFQIKKNQTHYFYSYPNIIDFSYLNNIYNPPITNIYYSWYEKYINNINIKNNFEKIFSDTKGFILFSSYYILLSMCSITLVTSTSKERISSTDTNNYVEIKNIEELDLHFEKNNVSINELDETLSSNEFLTEEEKEKIKIHYRQIYDYDPDFDFRIYNENLKELAIFKYQKQQTKKNSNLIINGSWDTKNRVINIYGDFEVSTLNHELDHLSKLIILKDQNGIYYKRDFSFNNYGQGIDEILNSCYNNIIHKKIDNGYNELQSIGNILINIIGEHELFKIYSEENIYNLETSLMEIIPDEEKAIELIALTDTLLQSHKNDLKSNKDIKNQIYELLSNYYLKKHYQKLCNNEESIFEFINQYKFFIDNIPKNKNTEKLKEDMKEQTKIYAHSFIIKGNFDDPLFVTKYVDEQIQSTYQNPIEIQKIEIQENYTKINYQSLIKNESTKLPTDELYFIISENPYFDPYHLQKYIISICRGIPKEKFLTPNSDFNKKGFNVKIAPNSYETYETSKIFHYKIDGVPYYVTDVIPCNMLENKKINNLNDLYNYVFEIYDSKKQNNLYNDKINYFK